MVSGWIALRFSASFVLLILDHDLYHRWTQCTMAESVRPVSLIEFLHAPSAKLALANRLRLVALTFPDSSYDWALIKVLSWPYHSLIMLKRESLWPPRRKAQMNTAEWTLSDRRTQSNDRTLIISGSVIKFLFLKKPLSPANYNNAPCN